LRKRKCFLALSYSIFDAARQYSAGGCTAWAGERSSTKIATPIASAIATVVPFTRLRHSASRIDLSPPKTTHISAIKATNNASSQSDAGRFSPLGVKHDLIRRRQLAAI